MLSIVWVFLLSDQIETRRVYWHSRRGMLELDLILVPFAEQCYAQLSADDQQAYRDLLECEDIDIYAWLMRRTSPPAAQLKQIVQQILAFKLKS